MAQVSEKKTAESELADDQLLSLGRRVLETEAAAVTRLVSRLGKPFVTACRLCLNCRGRIVVIGMGKSGHIAGKIAATLASTGSPAFFVHAGEASHGDMGMITGEDVVIALSHSGETTEMVTLLPMIKRLGVSMISMTGNPSSSLARAADAHLDVSVDNEACSLNLAPTASTTAALAMGDAIAIALLESRGFTEEDFAWSHPGGTLGRRLLLTVADIMHTGDGIPCVSAETLLSDALIEMTRHGLGMTGVIGANENVVGILTDGDLRRALDTKIDVHKTKVSDVMTRDPKVLSPDLLAAEAVHMMEEFKITMFLVVDSNGKLIGAFNVHDLLRSGIV